MAIITILTLLMVLSRPYPMTQVVHLADATNAIFFIGGMMLLPRFALVGFIILTVIIDYVAINHFGTSAFCVTRSYVFQWPAFTALWFGGRMMAHGQVTIVWGVKTLSCFCALQLIAFALTSGSFYYLSGRFADPTFSEMMLRTEKYLPGYVLSGFWYIALFTGLLVSIRYTLQQAAAVKND